MSECKRRVQMSAPLQSRDGRGSRGGAGLPRPQRMEEYPGSAARPKAMSPQGAGVETGKQRSEFKSQVAPPLTFPPHRASGLLPRLQPATSPNPMQEDRSILRRARNASTGAGYVCPPTTTALVVVASQNPSYVGWAFGIENRSQTYPSNGAASNAAGEAKMPKDQKVCGSSPRSPAR